MSDKSNFKIIQNNMIETSNNWETKEKKIRKLLDFWENDQREEILCEAEKIFEEYLEIHTQDTEAWIKFALFLYQSQLHDDLKAIDCLRKILDYDPKNFEAAAILAYVYSHSIGMPEEFFNQLLKISYENPFKQSVVYYFIGWYYSWHEDNDLQNHFFLKSTLLCDKYVNNFYYLGLTQKNLGMLEQANKSLEKALKNFLIATKDVLDEEDYDILSIEDFIRERVKGIFPSSTKKEFLKEDLQEIHDKLLNKH